MILSSYEQYKETGIGWLEGIPEHWGLWRNKYIFGIKKIIAGELGYDVLSVTQRGIVIKDTESGDGQLSMDYSKYQLVEPGDYAMNHMDLLTGYVDISKYKGVTSPDYRVMTILNESACSKTYYLYLLQMGYKQKLFFPLGQGSSHIGRWRLPTDAFMEILYPVPPYKEQTQIARFLDHEVDKIDTLIAEQEKLIALLKEKRQAVISHAVTKGLNPDVPMKDSGVEWLGQVPEHWVVKKLKSVAVLQNQKNDESDFYVALENIESWTGRYIETEADYSGAGVSFEEGDILFGKLRPYLAKVYLTGRDGIAFGDLLTFRPVNINPHFLFFSMLAEHFITAVDSSTYGSKMPRASADFITSMFVCVPPPSEQVEIADYIYSSIKSFDDLSANALNAIGLMQERRSALISAAVTGKIDVRGWQPPAAQ